MARGMVRSPDNPSRLNHALMNDPIFRLYAKEFSEIPLLSREEERVLFKKYKRTGDRKVFHKLVESNLRFVVFVAGKFSGFTTDPLDIISVGNMGLMEAIEKFDLSKNVRLTTYAVWWISEKIKRYLFANSRPMAHPYWVMSKEISETKTADVGLLHGKYDQRTLFDQRAIYGKFVSLDDSDSESGASITNFLPNTSVESCELSANRTILRDRVKKCLMGLKLKERLVLIYRFGLDDGGEKTLQEIGDIMSLSRERVRQLQASAFSKLRTRSKQPGGLTLDFLIT